MLQESLHSYSFWFKPSLGTVNNLPIKVIKQTE